MSCKPSLINPDFTGLYSVSYMGKQNKNKCWSKFIGSLIIILVIYSWVLGCLLPLIALFLIFIGYKIISLIIVIILVIPYLIPFEPKKLSLDSWICKQYVQYGSNYFDGGTSLSMEFEPKQIKENKMDNYPIITPIHPHGLFCIGK